MSKQQPDESFKDKVLRQLESGEADADTVEQAAKRDRLNVTNETVGSRRNRRSSFDPAVPHEEDTDEGEAKGKIVSPENKNISDKEKGDIKTESVEGEPKPSILSKVKAQVTEDDEDWDDELIQRKQNREQEKRVVSKIVTLIVLALLFIGGILGFYVYNFISSGLKPLDANSKKEIVVEIPSGSSNKAIGEILEKDKVIKSGMVFNYYTKFNNLTGFQAGTYSFSPSMTLDKIGKELQTGGAGSVNSDAKLTVPEGYDVTQIAAAVAKKTNITKKEFLDLMNDEAFFNQLKEKFPQLLESASQAQGVKYRLEGYLFPATYDYYKGTKLEDVVTQMVSKTNDVMSNYYEQIQQKGYTVQEVLTLASLVEKEGVTETDRKKIAQVFFNRMAVDMPLQSDISILYALGEHKELVTLKDLEVDSPYNLYKNKGYGPGPFDNPSEQSIQAVLNPTPNNYYYFVADIKDGTVYYAETLEQHNELVEKYVNN